MKESYEHLWPGVPLALASAILFGMCAPASKLLLTSMDPQMLAGVLYLGAGVGLSIFHASRGAIGLPAPEAPLRRTDMPWMVAVVLFGGVAGPLLLMLGLAHTTASSGSLLLNMESLFTMSIAWWVFRENVELRLLIGAAAIVGGAAVLSWSGEGARLDAGSILIAAACLSWGIDNNLTRKLSSADPVVTALIKGLAAGGVNVAIALARGAIAPPSSTIVGASLIGFLGIGVSLVLFVLALRHLGAARTGAYFSLAPFIGAVLSVALLGDTVSARLALAGALMAIGVWLHLSERHNHEHVHELLEHEHSHFHDEHHRHQHDGPVSEPHSHWHRHEPMRHKHVHYPDLHHRHRHG